MKLENLIDSMVNDDDQSTNKVFKLWGCYNPPPYRNLIRDYEHRDGYKSERLQHIIAEEENLIIRMNEFLGLWMGLSWNPWRLW
jgi:hypothetical protein